MYAMNYTLILITLSLGCIILIYINKRGMRNIKEDKKMSRQYRVLTEFILSEFPDSRIIKEDDASITIGCTGANGSTSLHIESKSKRIAVLYKTESAVFGTHELEWKFYEPMDQEEMIHKIKKDISCYNSKMTMNFG